MGAQPILETRRLRLRPFNPPDAPAVQRMAGDRAIAATTANVPHPYPAGAAEAWIATHPEMWAERKGATFAIVRKEDDEIVGAIGLRFSRESLWAELGYWVGKEWWSRGYASEAAAELVRYAFDVCRLNRVIARHFASNPASGKVMQNVGMKREGTLRQHFMKWGRLEDVVFYGLLAEERSK